MTLNLITDIKIGTVVKCVRIIGVSVDDTNFYEVCTHFLFLSMNSEGQRPDAGTVLIITDQPSSDYTPENTRADRTAKCQTLQRPGAPQRIP